MVSDTGTTRERGYDRRMRFPVVLFDLDGTLIDSGPIILESMQYAVRTVLGREIPRDQLGLTIGGQGIVAQMQAIDAEHADELLEAYKEHNDGLHETLQAFDGLLALLPPSAAVADATREALQEHIDELRRREVSWSRIGDALGISRQAAWERFA